MTTIPDRPGQPNGRPGQMVVPLEMPPDLQPLYANLVRISHTPAELVMDFARLLPGRATAPVLAQLIMSPVGAKLFYRALGENLARYEAVNGEINVPGETSLATYLFRPPQPPEPPAS